MNADRGKASFRALRHDELKIRVHLRSSAARLAARTNSMNLQFGTLVDRGFGHQDQLNQAHELMVKFEAALGGFRHTGALATDSDDNVPALQAADAISWASRRMVLDGTLPKGFEPLAELLRPDVYPPHQTIRVGRDGIQMLAEPINAWISRHGELPKLTDIASREVYGARVKLKDR